MAKQDAIGIENCNINGNMKRKNLTDKEKEESRGIRTNKSLTAKIRASSRKKKTKFL